MYFISINLMFINLIFDNNSFIYLIFVFTDLMFMFLISISMSEPRARPVSTAAAEIAVSTAIAAAAAVAVKINRGWGKKAISVTLWFLRPPANELLPRRWATWEYPLLWALMDRGGNKTFPTHPQW